MIVLLMRHAERVATPEPTCERVQPLTPLGLLQVSAVAREVRRRLEGCSPFACALVSPHRAARETAERLLAGLDQPLSVSECSALDPDASNQRDPRELNALVAELAQHHGTRAAILVVGHQPLLGELGRSWTGGRVSPVRGGVACIEREGTASRVAWLIGPDRA